MVDTQKLYDAIQHFKFSARPSNASGNAQATVRDIDNLIDKTAKLLSTFVEELEHSG